MPTHEHLTFSSFSPHCGERPPTQWHTHLPHNFSHTQAEKIVLGEQLSVNLRGLVLEIADWKYKLRNCVLTELVCRTFRCVNISVSK